MLTKFWEGVGKGLAEKWLSLIGPALVFWAGGFYFQVGWSGFKKLSTSLLNLGVLQQVALLVVVYLLLSGSVGFIQRLSYPLLRLLEGYWPVPFHWLRLLLTTWQQSRLSRMEHHWQQLEDKRKENNISPKELLQYSNMERLLHYIPSNPKDFMPTRLGNILRMAETQPNHKYGLDAAVCWSRLWLLLPENVREGLSSSRQSLNQAVELWTWGILFLVWGFKSWWALPIGIVWAWIAYRLAVNSAMNYADLIEATFDTHRWQLYNALHFDLPENVGDEPELGQLVTAYLWRGTAPDDFTFEHPS